MTKLKRRNYFVRGRDRWGFLYVEIGRGDDVAGVAVLTNGYDPVLRVTLGDFAIYSWRYWPWGVLEIEIGRAWVSIQFPKLSK